MFSVFEADLDPEEHVTLEQAAERARARLEDAVRARRELQGDTAADAGIRPCGGGDGAAVRAVLAAEVVGHAQLIGGWKGAPRRLAPGQRPGAVGRVPAAPADPAAAPWAVVLCAGADLGWLFYVLDQLPVHAAARRDVSPLRRLRSSAGSGTAPRVAPRHRHRGGDPVRHARGGRGGPAVLRPRPDRAGAGRRSSIPRPRPPPGASSPFSSGRSGVVVAYPFLPCSNSDAFKGLSVLLL